MENLHYFTTSLLKIGIIALGIWVIISPDIVRDKITEIYPQKVMNKQKLKTQKKEEQTKIIAAIKEELKKEESKKVKKPYALEFNPIKIRGMDVSHYQGDLLQQLKPSEELSFVVTKATEGSDMTDHKFASNWQLLKKKGLVRGAYHFYCTTSTPEDQANFFIHTLRKLEKYDLPPILDIENDGINNSVKKSKVQLQKDLLKWLQLVEEALGKKPMIYTGSFFYNMYLNDEKFNPYPLWIAHYTEEGTMNPQPERLKKIPWKIWQYTNTKRNASALADQNIYNGDMHNFTQFLTQQNE